MVRGIGQHSFSEGAVPKKKKTVLGLVSVFMLVLW